MKLRIILATILAVGLLLGLGSIAYADDGEGNADPPPENPGGNPDGSLVVHINIEGENPEVWINGQNLAEPTVIRQVLGGGGVDGGWVNRKINEALGPLFSWIDEYGGKVELTADGLAKVIILAQENESQIETQDLRVSDLDGRLVALESETVLQAEQLSAQNAENIARLNHLIDSYNRILAIIIGAFVLVVIGLATSLGVLWRKTRIS